MKRTFTSLVLGIALLVGGGGVGLAQDNRTAWAAYDRGDYATAFREWSVLAAKGDAIAQSALGLLYQTGRGVAQNDREAVRWYRLAAEQGDAAGQVILGDAYLVGRGITQDYREAARWYRLAAEQGITCSTKR